MTDTSGQVRLEGLDLARFLAFLGMVIVNFKIVMGADAATEGGILGLIATGLEGRAAASFVVLAGIGLGLGAARAGEASLVAVTLRRAAFLFIAGLLNSLIFDADILHYYAVYFLFAVACLPLSTARLIALAVAVNAVFVVLLFTLDYDAGWNWDTLTYSGFWTPDGFVHNLFFNGWHPVFPWLGFLLFGLILARLDLASHALQQRLVLLGAAALAGAELLSRALLPLAVGDAELAAILTTSPIPPMPLYSVAGLGASSLLTGLCLILAPALARIGALHLVVPAGRQTLTLYIAHILIGMGMLEALGLIGDQSLASAFAAALIFCAASVVCAWMWARRFGRGPAEAAMRRLAG